jgi:CheY-like chemotaxis protein
MLDFGTQRELPAVLLIDDDLVSREVTATLLTMTGYTVHTAESGPASLKMIESGIHPDIILMDAQMPGVSGIELVRALRVAAHPAAIYIVSGSQPSEELAAAADGFLLKPYSVEALRELLDRGLLSRGLIDQDLPDRFAQTGRSYIDPGDPVLNRAVLGQLQQLMPREAVREIYQAMVTDLDRRIEALEAAIDRRDAGEVRRIGHAIKGGCAMAGAVQASRLGALLENVSSNVPEYDSFDDSRALLDDLRVAAVALQHMLEDELER